MRVVAYIGGVLGLALLLVVMLHAGFPEMVQALRMAGWQPLWLAPYRMLFFALYALGWFRLLRPYDPGRRAGFLYVLWATVVRDAIDRLLPVASIGGGVVGVRLLRWQGLAAVPVAATVIVEILLTLIAVYLFAVAGLALLGGHGVPGGSGQYSMLLLATLPVPVIVALLLRYGSVFGRLERALRPLVTTSTAAIDAVALDHELHACLRRGRALAFAATLQFGAWLSGTFEVWFALHLFGHSVDVRTALVLESTTQAIRHLAFIVPGGIGVQEASLVLIGQSLGISAELALAVSMTKRVREVLCGLPALASWQVLEARHLLNR